MLRGRPSNINDRLKAKLFPLSLIDHAIRVPLSVACTYINIKTLGFHTLVKIFCHLKE